MSIDQKAVIVELAEIIAASAHTFERGFDKEAAARGHEIINNGGIFDFATCHTISLADACKKEAGELHHIVYLLLSQCWNDALGWVTEQNL